MNSQEIKELLEQHPYYIFGTGYVAGMLHRALKKQGLLNNLLAFCRSEVSLGETFMGVRVVPAEIALKSEKVILLGIHDGGLPSVPHADQMLHVYPCLKDWLFGSPLQRHVVLKTEQIRKKQMKDQYWIAVRYAGIEGITENNVQKKEIYLKSISMHSSRETAEGRLKSLGKLLEDAKRNGLDPNRPIALDEQYRIIDGLHRIAVAAWLNISEVTVDVYPESDVFDELFGPKNRLGETFLRENNFSEWEIGYLKECKKKCG